MMGFKAVISKKSINKSEMIAERFSNWLKEKETHQVFYIVPDHIKFNQPKLCFYETTSL